VSAAATVLEKPPARPGELSLQAKVFAFATMSVGFFIALLDIQIVSASLGEIGGGLSAGPDEIAWVQTSYLIAEIVVIPLSGWLSRVMSTRWLFCASAAGFTATSLLCGWAWDEHDRVSRAAGFSRRLDDPDRVHDRLCLFLRAAAGDRGGRHRLDLLPGADLGTDYWRVDNRKLFLALALLHQSAPGGIRRRGGADARADRPNLALLRGADYPGIALMALFLGCLEYTLEEGPRWDWFGDATIRATAWIAALAGVAFIRRSLTYAQPVVDLRALKSRNFSLGCFFSFVTGIGIFATIYLTPLFLGRVRGFSAFEIGLAVSSTGVFQVLAIPIYSFCTRYIDLRWLMMVGLACFALGMWNFTPITHDWGWRELLLPQAFRGFAQLFAVART
jgi:MFS transporter, DHA2 family, multidrug resistance protein